MKSMVFLVRCRESIVLIPFFFLRSDCALKFRILWSVLVTVVYINPEINEIDDFPSSLPRINCFDPVCFPAIRLCFEVSYFMISTGYCCIIILILKSMKSMVFLVRCRELIVFFQILFCDQIRFWSSIFYGRDWLTARHFHTKNIYYVHLLWQLTGPGLGYSWLFNSTIKRELLLDQNCDQNRSDSDQLYFQRPIKKYAIFHRLRTNGDFPVH